MINKRYEGFTLLLFAAFQKKPRFVEKLLEVPGVDVNAKYILGKPLMMINVIFLDEDDDLMLQYDGQSVLHMIMNLQMNRDAIVKKLLDAGADPNATSPHAGPLVYHFAMMDDVLHLLLSLKNTKINAKNAEGKFSTLF